MSIGCLWGVYRESMFTMSRYDILYDHIFSGHSNSVMEGRREGQRSYKSCLIAAKKYVNLFKKNTFLLIIKFDFNPILIKNNYV